MPEVVRLNVRWFQANRKLVAPRGVGLAKSSNLSRPICRPVGAGAARDSSWTHAQGPGTAGRREHRALEAPH